MKKLVIFATIIILVIVVLIYSILMITSPISVGVGYNSNTNEVKLYIENDSVFPIVVSDAIVLNEKHEPVVGDVFKIQLNDIKRFNVNREQLNEPELKGRVHIFEPFDSMYIKPNDKNNSYNILIENGDFKDVTEVVVQTRIFGILPYRFTKNITEKDETLSMSWGLKKLFDNNPELKNYTGTDIKIALIDSGVSSHSCINITKALSLIDNEPDIDSIGHGTQMAGLIIGESTHYRGVAPAANLYSVKIIDFETASIEKLEQAIEWAIDNEMDIINLSLAGNEEIKGIEDVFLKARQNGIHVVASVGDWDDNTIGYPAKFEHVIAVAGIDINGNRHKLSNFEEDEHILLSPGVAMLTTAHGEEYTYISGSSIATAFVSGLIAVLLEKHGHIETEELINMLHTYLQ